MFMPPLFLHTSYLPSPLNFFLLSTNSPTTTNENDSPSGSGGVLCVPYLFITER